MAFILNYATTQKFSSLNEMKFGTQINLVYTEYDGAIYFKFEDTCHLLSPIWSWKFFCCAKLNLRQIFLFFLLRQIKSAPTLEYDCAKLNPRQF